MKEVKLEMLKNSNTHRDILNELPNIIRNNIELSIPSDLKFRLASAATSISLNHYKSVSILCQQHLYCSAAALLRCQMELFVRGNWIYTAATSDELVKIETGVQLDKRHRKGRKTFNEYVEEMGETCPGIKKGVLSDFEHDWSALNGYTHGGSISLLRQLPSDSLQPLYSSDDIESLSYFANRYAMFCLQLVSVFGQSKVTHNLVEALVAKYTEIAKNKNSSRET